MILVLIEFWTPFRFVWAMIFLGCLRVLDARS